MQELRALCFETTDIVRAVVPFLQGRGEDIPRGMVEDVALASGPPFSCTLTILDDDGHRHSRVVDEATCAAALIAFCMDRRVPLPADATRQLEAVGGQAVMTFRVNGRRSLRSRRPAAR